jgi:LysM repeat protein
MRKSVFILLIVLLAALAAPVVAAPARDTTYTVRPGDTLFRIARLHGTTVAAIVAANDLSNPNLIIPGQVLVIPTGDGPLAAQPAAPAAPAAQPIAGGSAAGFTATVGTPVYSGDGQVVDIPITVTNLSVSPAIAGGKYTSHLKPDGNYEDMALAKAAHGTFETPLFGNSTVWQANVHLSDGSTHMLGVGCVFVEHVHAEGDEPLTRTPQGVWLTWYHYTIDLPDGWFDCGNTYRVNPASVAPGASATSNLRVYLVNPHFKATTGELVGTAYPGRAVTGLDVTVFKQDGTPVGTVFAPVP